MVTWIGDTEITAITELDPSQGRPSTQVKSLSVAPIQASHQADLEQIGITAMMIQDLHSEELGVDWQKENIKSLMYADPGDQSFSYRDYVGFLNVADVSLPVSGDRANLRTAEISTTYHPANTYRPSRALRGVQEQNDFGLDVPGYFMLPTQARSVRIVNPKGGNAAVSPIHTREITQDQGIDIYSVFRFMRAWDGDNSGATRTLQHNYRGMEGVDLDSQGDYTRPQYGGSAYGQVPSGDYKIRIRLTDTNQIAGDVRIIAEYSDNGWNEVLSETVTAGSDIGMVLSSQFEIPKNNGVRFQVEKETTDTNTISVDGGWLFPRYMPHVAFDLETDVEYDRDAFGFWPFVRGHGDTAQDVSPNRRDAEFNGSPEWTTDTQFGDYAVDMDASDFLSFGTMFSGRLDATFSTTIKPADLSATVGVAGEGAQGTPSWRIYYDNSSDEWTVLVRDVAGTTFSASGGTPVADEWTTLSFVYDSDNSELRLYEGTTEVGSTATNGLRMRHSVNETRMGDDQAAPNRLDGIIDSTRAFWGVRDSEISTFTSGSDRLDSMDSFTTHPRVAPVRVYDHNKSSDESDWDRVMSQERRFNGGIVVQNGLVRFTFNDPDAEAAHAYFWHQGEWQEMGNLVFKTPNTAEESFVQNPRLVEVTERTATLTFGVGDHVQSFTLHRGRYGGEFSTDGINRIKMETGNFVTIESGYVPSNNFYSSTEGNDVTVSSQEDNYILTFAPEQDAVYYATSTSSDGRQRIEDTDQKYGYDSLSTLEQYDVQFGTIPILSAENLTESGSDSMAREAERQIPLGTYVAAARVSFSDDTDDWTFDIENTGDSTAVDIDGEGVSKDVTESTNFGWYQRGIRLTDNDSEDSIELSWTQTSGTGSINIDQFVLFPISLQSGGSQVGVQDVAHESIRALRPESEIVQREGATR